MNERDMADLICMYDAYNAINQTLFGESIAYQFHQGNFGALSRVSKIIERSCDDTLKNSDFEKLYEILRNTNMTMEERAKRILGKNLD